MKAVLLAALILTSSAAAAQTIGGPHKQPASQIGGPAMPKNLAVARPRGTPSPAPSVAPTPPKPVALKPAVLPHPPVIQHSVIAQPSRPKRP